jgi:hypothetical protein
MKTKVIGYWATTTIDELHFPRVRSTTILSSESSSSEERTPSLDPLGRFFT